MKWRMKPRCMTGHWKPWQRYLHRILTTWGIIISRHEFYLMTPLFYLRVLWDGEEFCDRSVVRGLFAGAVPRWPCIVGGYLHRFHCEHVWKKVYL